MNSKREIRLKRRVVVTGLAALFAISAGFGDAVAQVAKFPQKQIHLLVGSSPGGGGDIVARALSERLSKQLGQPIIVDNKPGGSGNIAAARVAGAAPDGYTLLLAYTGHVINPSLFSQIPFDTVEDFKPIAMIATNTTVLIVPKDSPFKNLKDLIEFAKQNPKKLNFGTMLGTSQHLGGVLFEKDAGVSFETIPYKGNAAALQDLVGGRLDFMLGTVQSIKPAMDSGMVRALAVTSAERSGLLPDVPTFAESVPGFSTVGWYGIVAPKGTPDNVVNVIYDGIKESLNDPALRTMLANTGNEIALLNPTEFDAFVRAEVPRWIELTNSIGLEKM